MSIEDMKNHYTQMPWEDKMSLLKSTKEKQDRGQYCTLLTWLDETPLKYGGCPISDIPEEFYWSP